MDMLIHVLLVLVIVGVIMYVVQNWLPVDAMIKKIIMAVIAVIAVIWLITRVLPVLFP